MQYVLDAITEGYTVETYAQIKYGFWYKGYCMTPAGALKWDTGGEHVDLKPFARNVIKAGDLRSVPLNAVLENWAVAGLWERSRSFGALLLRTWKAHASTYYSRVRSA
jgi:hypothetical protein